MAQHGKKKEINHTKPTKNCAKVWIGHVTSVSNNGGGSLLHRKTGERKAHPAHAKTRKTRRHTTKYAAKYGTG